MAATIPTTSTAPGTSGADQNILNKLNSTGQNPFNDLTLFNSNRVDGLLSSYLSTNPEKVTGMRLDEKNAPNTSPQNRSLANQTFALNDQTYNTGSQQIANQTNRAVLNLAQQTRDQNSQALQLFGQASLLSPTQSSRNRSYVSDIGAQSQKVAFDISSQGQDKLSQLALGYAQGNVQAMTQARQLDFQDQQFDFNKKVTEASLTGNYNDKRTLQGMQFDQAAINNKLNQALTISGLTGKMPDLANIGNLYDEKGNLTPLDLNGQLIKQQASADYTLQGQSAKQGLESGRLNIDLASAGLIGTRANFGLDLKTGAIPEGYKYDDSPAGKKALAEVRAAEASIKQNEFILNSFNGQINGVTGQMAQLATDAGSIKSQLDAALADPNPNSDTIKGLSAKYFAVNKQLATMQGTGNGIYYTAEATPVLGKDGSLTYTYNEKAINNKDGKLMLQTIGEKGLDGGANFTASGNPELNAILTDKGGVRDRFSQGLLLALQSGNTAQAINKIFYPSNAGASGDSDTVMLALRQTQTDKDGKVSPSNTYQFQEIDMKGLNFADRGKLQIAIQTGKATDGRVTDNTPTGLNNLQAILNEYKGKGLGVNAIFASDVIDKLKSDPRYTDVGTNIIYDDGPNKFNNSQFLPMILAGSTIEGAKMNQNDFGGDKLSNLLSNYRTFSQKATDQGLNPQAIALFMGNQKEFPALPDGTPNPFGEDKEALSSIAKYYNSMLAATNSVGQSNQYLRALMSGYGGVSGGSFNENLLSPLVNPKAIQGGELPLEVKNIINKYGTSAAGVSELNTLLDRLNR